MPRDDAYRFQTVLDPDALGQDCWLTIDMEKIRWMRRRQLDHRGAPRPAFDPHELSVDGEILRLTSDAWTNIYFMWVGHAPRD